MFVYDRAVRWSDVDAAGIVFFPRFLEYCHDAIEAMFAALPGGYATLTQTRRIGVPAVHLDVNFRAPLRYGDVCRVRLSVTKVGRASVTFLFAMARVEATGIETRCCDVEQVVVVTDLEAMKGIEIPDDVRHVLSEHLTG